MRESLLTQTNRGELLARLDALRPDAQKRWGRMSVGGMLSHLTDAFRLALGEVQTTRMPKLYERTLLRLVALHTPIHWPHGVKTVDACDQEAGGTPPVEFERDKATLRSMMDRFVTEMDPDRVAHPIFGPLSTEEWGRWGYRHVDHHLRQFSA